MFKERPESRIRDAARLPGDFDVSFRFFAGDLLHDIIGLDDPGLLFDAFVDIRRHLSGTDNTDRTLDTELIHRPDQVVYEIGAALNVVDPAFLHRPEGIPTGFDKKSGIARF